MSHFTSAADVDHWPDWLTAARAVKDNPRAQPQLGTGRAMCLLFLNPSLRTRLSTQRAALNLGLNVVVFNVQQGGWQLEMTDGTVMSGNRAEHVREAAAVIGQYYDVIGVRAFATLQDRDEDYAERVIQQFVRYAGVPVVSLESSVRHPLQSFTDLITIEEYKPVERPKVVISWAPHPRALPQAVVNSLLEVTPAHRLRGGAYPPRRLRTGRPVYARSHRNARPGCCPGGGRLRVRQELVELP